MGLPGLDHSPLVSSLWQIIWQKGKQMEVGTITAMPPASDKRAAIEMHLGMDVVQWLRRERRKEPRPSYDRLAAELIRVSGRDINGETLRAWDRAAAPEGNGDPG